MKLIALLLLLVTTGVVAQAQTSPSPSVVHATMQTTTDPFEAQRIPRNSRVYIAPFRSENYDKPVEGFESYVAAALRKKNVPLIMVADRSQADFEIVGTADKKEAGWAKKVLLADWRDTTSASMSVINVRTGVIAYADASHRSSANKGLRSSAEKLAKYLKKKIEDDEKKKRN